MAKKSKQTKIYENAIKNWPEEERLPTKRFLLLNSLPPSISYFLRRNKD